MGTVTGGTGGTGGVVGLVLAAVVALTGSLVGSVAPGLASAPAEAGGPRHRALIIFDKDHDSPYESRVVWRLYERRKGPDQLVERREWRAGAGMPRKGGTDPCARNTGWLPDGRYRLTFHRDYAGSIIKGRAFRLDDMRCHDGTQRHSLFLHTEQGAGNAQCRNRRGDQDCRWEHPRINDYASHGCIKMAPADLRQLARLFERRFAAHVHHARGTVELVVR